MIRWAPFGQPAGTPWRNGNPAVGERGSIIDARAIDHAQAEIVNAISRLGLTPDANNLEQLGLAIQNYVSSLTGEGGDDTFLTVPSARATLPIFPEVLTADGRLAISSPSSGTLFVAATGGIRHRGVFDVLMSDIAEVNRTFAMLPSKVAHLRWSPTGGLERFYLDDPAYNPLGLAETDPSFDSSYDSALLARASTDAGANITITSLINRDRLMHAVIRTQTFARTSSVVGGGGFIAPFDPVTLNWARTPIHTASASRSGYSSSLPAPPEEPFVLSSGVTSDGTGSATASVSRYSANYVAAVDLNWAGVSLTLGFQLSAVFMA